MVLKMVLITKIVDIEPYRISRVRVKLDRINWLLSSATLLYAGICTKSVMSNCLNFVYFRFPIFRASRNKDFSSEI